MDRVTKSKRSEIMSSVRHGNTGIEQTLRKELRKFGFRGYRISPCLPGKPDIYFSKYKLAVFVDGCFWHGCLICNRMPKSNTEFWHSKIKRNTDRDKRNSRELTDMGLRVLRFWEHDIKHSLNKVICAVDQTIRTNDVHS